MKKLLSIAFFIGLSCFSLNAEVAEVNTGLSVEQCEDLKIFVRNCGSEKVKLSDDGKVLIFADPSVVESAVWCALSLGLAAFFVLYQPSKKGKKETLIMLAGSSLFLGCSAVHAFALMRKLEKKNKKTPWLTLDNEQISIDEEGGVSVVNWNAVASIVCKTSTTDNSVTESVVKLNNKYGVTMETIDALELPIDLETFCNLMDYYLRIQK